MKNRSIWSETKINKKYPKLDNDISVDILIIGGGITGVNTLYYLKDKGAILVERNKIASGITQNSTAKITYLQDKYNEIIKKHNEVTASLYLKSQIEAIKQIKKIIEKHNIKCDFVKSKSTLYVNDKKNIEKIKEVKKLLNKNNIKVVENYIDIKSSKYSISIENSYLFNPIKYIDGLLNQIDNKIYENTNIIDIEHKDNKYICKTDTNTITCNKVILATHYPYFIYPYFFPLKGYLEKSYIVSYKEKNNDNISLISYDKPITSIRTYQDNIIYLGETHNICNKIDDKKNFDNLLKRVDKKPNYIWSNIDIITNDYLPYIGYIKDDLLIATGYNTWGMTNSILSAIIIKDLIENKENIYIDLFDPKRTKNKIRIIEDSFCSIKGYYDGYKFKNNKIKYDKINGISVMIYEENNKKYIVKRKCPHAKCNLIFNEIEKTFDCPCHSSRFDLQGNVIKGPSKYNIKIN